MHFRPNEYKVWKEFKDLAAQPNRKPTTPQPPSRQPAREPQVLTKKEYGSTISRSSTPLEIDEKFELSDKQIQAILDAFKRFDKKDHGFI